MSDKSALAEVSGSLVGGGAAGAFLTEFAKTLGTTWQARLIIAAPVLAATWAAVWPHFLQWIQRTIERYQWPKEQEKAILIIERTLDAAAKLLPTIENEAAKLELKTRSAQLQLIYVRVKTAVPLTYPWKEYSGAIGGETSKPAT